MGNAASDEREGYRNIKSPDTYALCEHYIDKVGLSYARLSSLLDDFKNIENRVRWQRQKYIPDIRCKQQT